MFHPTYISRRLCVCVCLLVTRPRRHVWRGSRLRHKCPTTAQQDIERVPRSRGDRKIHTGRPPAAAVEAGARLHGHPQPLLEVRKERATRPTALEYPIRAVVAHMVVMVYGFAALPMSSLWDAHGA